MAASGSSVLPTTTASEQRLRQDESVTYRALARVGAHRGANVLQTSEVSARQDESVGTVADVSSSAEADAGANKTPPLTESRRAAPSRSGASLAAAALGQMMKR